MRLVMVIGVGLAVLGVGCAGRNVHDVPPCELFLASLYCGEVDFSTIFPESYCEPYNAMTCDMNEYFTCLADSSECDEEAGVFILSDRCPLPKCDG